MSDDKQIIPSPRLGKTVESEFPPEGVHFYGRRIQLLRTIKGMSIGELATELGVQYERVSSWEGEKIILSKARKSQNYGVEHHIVTCTRPTNSTLARICVLFDVLPSFFFDEKIEKSLVISYIGNLPSINILEKEE